MTPIETLYQEWQSLKEIGSRSGAHYVTSAYRIERFEAAMEKLMEKEREEKEE